MSQLKVMADDCHDKVSAIDSKFDEWLRYTGDLHAACVDTDTTGADQIHETAIDKILKETQLECRFADDGGCQSQERTTWQVS